MQPTLFTAAYAADRAAVAAQAPRPARRVRFGRKAATVAFVAVALAAGVATATATATAAQSDTGVMRHSELGSGIVSPGQFGWQAHCPHTGPAPR